MSRIALVWLGAVAFAAATPVFAGSTDAATLADPDCEVVRILSNGRQTVTPPRRAHREGRRHGGPAYASASSTSRGGSSASASVASSNSGGRGRAVASSSSSGGGRTVTRTSDENGCRVVIDHRRQGE